MGSMSQQPSNRPWWNPERLPLPVAILPWPFYVVVAAAATPIVMVGMLFGLHLPESLQRFAAPTTPLPAGSFA